METTQHTVIPLWPGAAPGSEAWDQVEEEFEGFPGMPAVRNVTRPSLTVYRPEKPNGAAVIVAPGGAWHFLAIEHEGRQVAEWLSSRGITAFILKYRLIKTGRGMQKQMEEFFSNQAAKAAGMAAIQPFTLADAQQAVRVVRQCAGDWGVDPARIGFMGFSAGGAVAAHVARDYTPDCRPDFVAPIYAAVFDEVQAPPDAPPLFLLCSQSDEMASRASLILYSAWNAARRPVEMHIYAHGEHGFGMHKKGLPSDTWIDRFEDWMKGLGVL